MKTKYIKTKVAGITFDGRQEIIRNLKDTIGVYYELLREKDNKYDTNAVIVCAKTRDNKKFNVGYLPKDMNKAVARALDNNKTAFVKRYTYTGAYNKNVNTGIELELVYGL